MTSKQEMTQGSPERVKVVKRNDIRAIRSVEVEGELHHLGEHRDFRRHDELRHFLPESGRHSFSWVSLKEGEVLDNHQHPTASMIVVCQGEVYVTGEQEQLLSEGDIVCVPPDRLHGFKTLPGQAFHGMSIQFEGLGLYEDDTQPRVEFLAYSNHPYSKLEELNQHLLELHCQNSLFQLFNSGQLEQNTAQRKKFLEALYVWSKYFQKMLYARQAYCQDAELLPLYAEHLSEEYGHDILLLEQNALQGDVYDPVLEASSQWFINKMLTGDEAEKIVAVHMVVESSGFVFGQASRAIFNKQPAEDDYFDIHAEVDEHHSQVGREYLQALSPRQFPKLMEVCRQSWDQMNIIHQRIVDICMK